MRYTGHFAAIFPSHSSAVPRNSHALLAMYAAISRTFGSSVASLTKASSPSV